MNTTKLYIPFFLVETYLFLGLWLFFYGPVIWPMQNTQQFLGYISLYHVFFAAGYFLQTEHFRQNQKNTCNEQETLLQKNHFTTYFWTVLTLAFIASMIAYRNLTLSHSFIPDNILSNLHRGLVTPWEARAYYASDSTLSGFVKYPTVTALLLLTAPFKYILLPGLVYYWHLLSSTQKMSGILVACIPILAGITASVSVINFSYLFIISICLGTLILSKKSNGIGLTLKSRKFFVCSLVFILFFSFWQFYSVKSGQTPYQVAIENKKPHPFDFLKKNEITFRNELKKEGTDREVTTTERSNTVDFYEKITAYMVQGYQGMSIALGEKFESSFGIGHSIFLQRVFADYFHLDVRHRTFQHKISDRWDQNILWHSFYSYIANDVGFLGVAIVMLILGAYFSKVYLSAIMDNNLYAKMLLPLFGILFLYIPANNQVFSFLESMTSFWVLTVLFILSVNHDKRQADTVST